MPVWSCGDTKRGTRGVSPLRAGNSGEPDPDDAGLAQPTSPADVADLIDQLRAAGTILTYDPDNKTVRAGDRDTPSVVIAQDRQQRAIERRTA